jgi:hypothetical protein
MIINEHDGFQSWNVIQINTTTYNLNKVLYAKVNAHLIRLPILHSITLELEDILHNTVGDNHAIR